MTRVSRLAQNVIGSEIIKIASEVNQKISLGETIHNLTIGDFEPDIFPIPVLLKDLICEEINNNQTNYPPSDGLLRLRQSVSDLVLSRDLVDYQADEILIAAGARPIIYSIFKTIVDPDDVVLFPVPSWNNNHYTYLNTAKQIAIYTKPENNFMPSADDIRPYISEVSLIALCSPQNPTGTVFTKSGLEEICDLIIEENKKRVGRKPLYLMFDQIYCELCFGDTKHHNPVFLRPEMKNFTIFVDGISKSLSATGVRVGWALGPIDVISKMKSILTHIGAWAPKAEQVATARFLNEKEVYKNFIEFQKFKISQRLDFLYDGIINLKSKGFKIDVIKPQAAIYLTVQFDLIGLKTSTGKKLESPQDITRFLLDEAGIGVVPFYAFGSQPNSTWFRISVGTIWAEDMHSILSKLETALNNVEEVASKIEY